MKNLAEQFKDWWESLTPEEQQKERDDFNEIRQKNKKPIGWLSIEDYLPAWLIKDLEQGYSVYKVRNKKGEEFESRVTDHNIWYYHAKEIGITHWYNEYD